MSLVPACVLLWTELPQLAINMARPIRMKVNNRFMYRTYRIVIQVGSLVELSPLTKGGFNALREPVFWSTPSWKILLAGESSTYNALLPVATLTNDGVVQPSPQSKGDALET